MTSFLNIVRLESLKMVEIFIDSAEIEEIRKVKSWGLLDGVTTNPSLIKKAVSTRKNIDMEKYIGEILKVSKGKPVSLEVIGTDYESMTWEGLNIYKKFNKVAKNVYVKIPVNPCLEEKCSVASDGIKTIKKLSSKKIPINCTLVFTPEQALIAAKAGASFVSPFMGREDDYIREINRIKFKKEDYFPKEGFQKGKKVLEDNGIVSGVGLIEEIDKIFEKNKIKTKILAASIRSVRQFREAIESGADIVTIPFSVFEKLLVHSKTSQGMKSFVKDIVPEYERVVRNKN